MRLLRKKYCTYPNPGEEEEGGGKKKKKGNHNVHSVNPLPYKNSVTKFQTMNMEETFELTNGN